MSKTVWIINQYASTPTTGVGGRHYYMAREMSKQGYSVYLIGSSSHHILHSKPPIDKKVTVEKVEGFKFVWIRMPSYENAHSKMRAFNWFLFPLRLQRLLKFIPNRPDVILISSPSLLSFLGARRLAYKMKVRLVFEVRDIWPLTLTEIGGYSARHPFIRFMQWVEDKAYRESDAVVSNLKNSVEHMLNRGMDGNKFTWIPNGFSLDEVNKKIELNEISAGQMPVGKFVVGYTGTIGIANSLDTFVSAAGLLKKYTDIAFVLVGSGKEKQLLQSVVHKENLDNVFFIEPIPKVEIQSMLSRFDVCYIGLTKDPLFKYGVSPNKLFDYLYSGKPIIYGIDSGDYRPVEEASAGVQIPAEDPKSLGDAVLKLYNMNKDARDEMGANGRRAALAQYEYSQLSYKLSRVLFDA